MTTPVEIKVLILFVVFSTLQSSCSDLVLLPMTEKYYLIAVLICTTTSSLRMETLIPDAVIELFIEGFTWSLTSCIARSPCKVPPCKVPPCTVPPCTVPPCKVSPCKV